MGNPFTEPSLPGTYNASPPEDDGTESSSNEIAWAKHISKIGDPLKTYIGSVITNVTTAFGYAHLNSVSTTATNYTVATSDRGKMIRVTATATITLPAAATATSGFEVTIAPSGGVTVTVDGDGSELIDGVASVSIEVPTTFVCDGSGWYSAHGTVASNDINLKNVSLDATVDSGALTISLIGWDGNAPSGTNKVTIPFRSATAGDGSMASAAITSANTLVISSGSLLGTSNSVPFRLWIVAFNDGGTIRLGAVNCDAFYPLRDNVLGSSSAEGGAGAADSSQVIYSGSAVSSKPIRVLGYLDWNNGLSAAGTWNAEPDEIQIFHPGIRLPGERVQIIRSTDGTLSTGTTAMPNDDTTPQNNEGDQYMSQAITPGDVQNILVIRHQGNYSAATAVTVSVALFQDSNAGALAAGGHVQSAGGESAPIAVNYKMLANTTSPTTFKIRAGTNTGSTLSFNGTSGSQRYNGLWNSILEIEELMG